jgi:dUTP pyrophosphatase
VANLMLIYLSHPIDLADSALADRIEVATRALEEAIESHKSDVVVFRPQQAFFVASGAVPDPSIEMINRAAQSQANGMLVFWPKGSRSWGVPVEVERAINSGLPVAFVSDAKQTWSMPQAWFHNQLLQEFDWNEDALKQAILWLELMARADIGSELIPTVLLDSTAQMPTKAYSDDAGFDLYVSEDTLIEPGEFVDVPCAVAVELPSDTWALLTGRSSTLRQKQLMVNQGVIDPGYRGELFAGVWNLGSKVVEVKAGERLAQLILMPNHALHAKLVTVNELAPHQRGQSGFGSSGR